MKIFIIAGEASGDQLGASLIMALKKQSPKLEIRGIGGQAMKEAGLKESFFPMEELSLMGIAEIVPHIPKMLKRIRQTVDAIRVFNPDVVVTVDAPEFCFRVQEKLKAAKCHAKRVHVVAPSVWAWREGRSKKIAQFLDMILCLYPFEVDYFLKEGLRAKFIGHPLISSGILDCNGPAFRFRHMIGSDCKIVGLFFGSRTREVEDLSEIILQTALKLREVNSDLFFLAPTIPRWQKKIEDSFKVHNLKGLVISDKGEKWDAFSACDCAVAVSGTVALELAVAQVPHVILYKMNKLTWAIIDRVVKTPYAHLANILLKREAVPEFIQNRAKAENITSEIHKLLNDGLAKEIQKSSFADLTALLSPPETQNAQKNPADCAAGFIIDLINET